MPAQLYNPKKALYAAFPKMAALSKSADTTMNNAEQELARRETAGVDTSYARLPLRSGMAHRLHQRRRSRRRRGGADDRGAQ